MTRNESHPLDPWIYSRGGQMAAFAWGFAEATLFFIVPDVLLTLIACRSLRASLKACGAAIVGALLGGIIMYAAAGSMTETLRSWLVHLPGIHSSLLQRVQLQLAEHGLGALLVGPALGIPYKIYAVEWGARHGNCALFLLVSVPARGIRFVLSALLTNFAARLVAPWTQRRARIEVIILGLFWIAFYAFYFARFC